MFDSFESNNGHNFCFFSIFLLKTLILFTNFNKRRKQSNLDWTMDRNIMWSAEERKIWTLKFSPQNARRWMRRSEKCYKDKNLCTAYCSTMLGQCLLPITREKNALKSLMPALNKEPSGYSGTFSSEQHISHLAWSTWNTESEDFNYFHDTFDF